MPVYPPYPPYQQPVIDPGTGLVSKPWQLFFLSLLPAEGTAIVTAIPPGSLPVDRVEVLNSPRLLGRGSPGVGPAEEIAIGAGLTMTGTTLAATGGGGGTGADGYWTPITDGVTPIAELLFDTHGDCIVGFVPTAS